MEIIHGQGGSTILGETPLEVSLQSYGEAHAEAKDDQRIIKSSKNKSTVNVRHTVHFDTEMAVREKHGEKRILTKRQH